jgi:cell division protein FtsL
MNEVSRRFAVAGVLAVALTGSGIWTIVTEHESRRLFVELEELKREEDRLQIDWWRLQLEQSTQATHARIESIARERLQLVEPEQRQIRVLAEAAR